MIIKKFIKKKGSDLGLYPTWVIPYTFQGKTNKGYCTICERETYFAKVKPWLRDHYLCAWCKSIPRNRALVHTLQIFYPNWRDLHIHESSPGGPSSKHISRQCKNYIPSQYFLDTELGAKKGGVRCENLEKMTFTDETFDLIITQDVFEHVMHPADAFREINRVLKPGGAHIFTMPWYPKLKKTVQRARQNGKEVEFLEKPVYHGNPIDPEGSLVTFDWGLDFTDFIYQYSGMFTTIYLHKNEYLGLEAEFLEVFISRKTSE